MKGATRYHLWCLTIGILLALVPPGFAQGAPIRIVSTAPSITELVCALGKCGSIVGVTTFCDRPKEALPIAKVGGPANPSVEAILRLKPDLVLVDEEGLGPKLALRLQKLGIKTAIFRGSRLSKLPTAIKNLGSELHAEKQAESLAKSIEMATAPALKKQSVRTLFVVWPDPLISIGPGTLVHDILTNRGFNPVINGKAPGYPRLSHEAAYALNPSLVIIGQGKTLGQPVERMLKNLKQVDAVKAQAVCKVSDALFRPGPRIPEGVAEIEQCLSLVK